MGAKVDATCDLTRVMIGYRRLRPVVAEGPAVFWSGAAVRWQRPPEPPIGANFWPSREPATAGRQSDEPCAVVRYQTILGALSNNESATSHMSRLFLHSVDPTGPDDQDTGRQKNQLHCLSGDIGPQDGAVGFVQPVLFSREERR